MYIPHDADNIGEAIGYADGDTIFVPEGEHLLGVNTVYSSVAIIGIGDPDKVIITQLHKGGLQGSAWNPSIILKNLTFDSIGRVVLGHNSQTKANVHATNVIFKDIIQTAIAQTSQLEASFKNCIFYNCQEDVFNVYGNVLIENCVFFNNKDVLVINPSQGYNSGIIIRNSIFYNNSGDNIIFDNFWYEPYELPSIEYSNISLNKVSGYQGALSGEGLIDSDPLFIDVENYDFHLQDESPCIDTGNPDSEYNDPDGSNSDMGAYGGPNGSW